MTTASAVQKTEGRKSVLPYRQIVVAGAIWLLTVLLLRQPLTGLVNLSLRDERSTHTVLIPFLSLFLIYLRRHRIFSPTSSRRLLSLPILATAGAIWFTMSSPATLDHPDALSVSTLAIVLVWIAIFLAMFGAASFQAAAFPLLVLFLMVPLPTVVADYVISVLQRGSAEASYALFRLTGSPIVRDGFRMSLPGADIEIAKECSGIRSGLSLFITGLLASHLFLDSTWKKALFSLLTIPIGIFKNAVRIVVLSLLGIHVNPDFFHGRLHQQGGVLFSLLGLSMLAATLYLLKQPWRKKKRTSGGDGASCVESVAGV
jgi:exosortase